MRVLVVEDDHGLRDVLARGLWEKSEALVATLPVNEAPAPWECRCSALLWLGRGGRAAAAAMPPCFATLDRSTMNMARRRRWRCSADESS